MGDEGDEGERLSPLLSLLPLLQEPASTKKFLNRTRQVKNVYMQLLIPEIDYGHIKTDAIWSRL